MELNHLVKQLPLVLLFEQFSVQMLPAVKLFLRLFDGFPHLWAARLIGVLSAFGFQLFVLLNRVGSDIVRPELRDPLAEELLSELLLRKVAFGKVVLGAQLKGAARTLCFLGSLRMESQRLAMF